MSQSLMDELEARFRTAARGRAVAVSHVTEDSLLARDYTVAYRSDASLFKVTFRRGGLFERAYRGVERWIEAEAEKLDGVQSVPDGHADLRREMQFWMVEQFYDQFRSELERALSDRAAALRGDLHRPLGPFTGNAMADALEGFTSFLAPMDQEVRRGVLSPLSIRLFQSMGLRLFADRDPPVANS